jgi:hypothetical protein
VLDPHKTLAIDAATFAVSALIVVAGVRSRPAPARAGGTRALLWSVSAVGIRIVFGSRLLMAAVPLGMVIGAFLLGRVTAPSARIRMMGWLAVLSCAPLIGSAWNPPLWAVLALWTLAGAGGAYQLAAAAAFVQARVRGGPVRPVRRARARPDRGHHARHELDTPARLADPGTAERAGEPLTPAARSAAC